MSETNLLLWADVESTGLLDDPRKPTILEASWTITDPTGLQVTPLRQRYSVLQVDGDDGQATRIHLPAHDDDGTLIWTHEDVTDPAALDDGYPVDAVRTMHQVNGLAEEIAQLVTAQPGESPVDDTPDGELWKGMLTDWPEWEALLRDDLDRAGWSDIGERGLNLAGGGISHYEHRFMPRYMPELFADKRMHYAVVDVSTVLRSLQVRVSDLPRKADGVLEWANRHRKVVDQSWRRLDIGPDFAAPDPDWDRWSTLTVDDHRAASGVARALMAYRLLPELLAAQSWPALGHAAYREPVAR